ncbi:MAG: xanthine dehydrogenase family protein molybdopterin-binding subunit, partial [Nitrososphaerota archaeon]|nr:xanthine dehydrogenase family protein molybdopterin-binding subunit [Nitrososphaerota archaeon]
YMVPTAADIPKIHIEFMDSANAYGPYGAKGIGEISTIPVAASVVHAMHDVTGLYLRELPLSGKLNL